MTKNTIAFQHGFLIVPSIGVDNRSMAMNVQAELMKFGYMLNEDAFKQLGYSDAADIKAFHSEVISMLKRLTGGEYNHTPIYPGFPQQVMDMTERELWMNQLIGYWSGGSFTPNAWTKRRPEAFEHVKYKIISSGNEESFKKIFILLTSSGNSITKVDMETIKWFLNNYRPLVFPEIIPFKENLCTIFGECIKNNISFKNVQFPKLTTTDVLRIAVFLSGGDISLPAVPKQVKQVSTYYRYSKIHNLKREKREKFKFKKFSRSERRKILELLENSNLDVREMVLKDQRWIRLGEILHPGEYKNSYPRCYRAFDKLRNQKIISWYGELQAAFNQSFDVGLTKLSERPGEFLRRLDWLIRSNGVERRQSILNHLAKIAVNSSNKVIFEVFSYFEGRNVPTQRSVFIKGARKKTPLPSLPPLKEHVIEAVQQTLISALKEKFTKLSELGDCWIDEELRKIPLPTNMRSMSESLVPIIRGQRIPMASEKNVIRPFVHWLDKYGDMDIDLHGYLIGNKQSVFFGYNGIHSNKIGCYSGDVRNRKGACAEYVDININEAVNAGFKYFLIVPHNFSNPSFKNNQCVVGVMEREYPESNESWLPETITNSMVINSDARTVLAGAYDLIAREYIHLDLDFGDFSTYVNDYSSTELFKALQSYLELPKLSVYDLLLWHIEARGRLVSKESAQTHFLFEDFSSSYTKTIEYLGI